MTAQIIPFQTKTHRTLALARAWYYQLKKDNAEQGLIVDREKVIKDAVVEAFVEEQIGRRYWENSDVDEKRAQQWRGIVRIHMCVETQWIEHWLDNWLHGKLQRVKAVAPRRPPRRKPRIDDPIPQIIPFPSRCAENVLEAVAK